MKYLSYLFLFALVLSVVGCDDDSGDDEQMAALEYSVTVMSPDASAKMVGDDIHIHVNFDEANMGTVHHVNVQILEKGNETNVLYNGPADAHVHEESGHYEHHDDVTLAGADVMGDTEWILRAKVWGHDAGLAEVSSDVEFALEHAVMTPPSYSIAIMSPSADDKTVGDDIHIHVNFDEANMGTVHHANVKIYEKGNDSNIIFNGPAEAHVHEESGHYELHADVTLEGSGIAGDTDWVVEAKVWGHEAGAAEVIETREFHLNPM